MNENTTRAPEESEVMRLYNSMDEPSRAIALNLAEMITAALISSAKIQIAASGRYSERSMRS